MAAHTPAEFTTFMSQLKETNQSLDFFCDFDKIHSNVDDIRLSLCMLNSLIGVADMRSAVETIWRRDRTAFNVMDILIAVRSEGKKKVLNSLGECVTLDTLFESIDGVMEFLENTGLAEVLQSRKITNLVDYVFGVETGLDSNARKNRSGHVMENMVAEIFNENAITYIIAKTKCYKSQNQTRFFEPKSRSKRNATKIWRTHINQSKTKESSNGVQIPFEDSAFVPKSSLYAAFCSV